MTRVFLLALLVALAATLAGCGDGNTAVGPPPPPGGSHAFTKHPGNPVFRPGAAGTWDADYIGRPSVVERPDGMHALYYGGHEFVTFRGGIGLATSNDGVTWTRVGTAPVLGKGPVGAWDDHTIFDPCVVLDGTTYRLFYAGLSVAQAPRFGFATSSDGITWTKAGPVLGAGVVGSWEEWIEEPTVLKDGSTFKLWYVGFGSRGGSVGFATSSDGVTWTKPASAGRSWSVSRGTSCARSGAWRAAGAGRRASRGRSVGCDRRPRAALACPRSGGSKPRGAGLSSGTSRPRGDSAASGAASQGRAHLGASATSGAPG